MSGPHDPVLERWRLAEAERMGARLPSFAATSRHGAPLLALLETPAASGAERSGETSVQNQDSTSRFQRHAIMKAGLDVGDVVFWNLWAGYDTQVSMRTAADWAAQCQRLIRLMPMLRAVLVFGNNAWLAARLLDIDRIGPLIGAPHPSSRGRSSHADAPRLIEEAWQRAARLLSY